MSKQSLNSVLLIGRVCKPPQQIVSRAGKPMLTVCLAVDRPAHVPPKVVSVVTGTGRTRALESDYPIVVITGDLALELGQQIHVGAWLYASGIFQTRNIDDHSTEPPRKRVVHEVLALDARLLPAADAAASSSANERKKRKRRRPSHADELGEMQSESAVEETVRARSPVEPGGTPT